MNRSTAVSSTGPRRLSVAEMQRVLQDAASAQPPVTGAAAVVESGFTAVVRGAQPQVGTTTVALAVSEALAANGWHTHLIDVANPDRCGLAGVTSRELGVLERGDWRRGMRDALIVDRRARPDTAGLVRTLPPIDDDGRPRATIVDVGHGKGHEPEVHGTCRVVLVCRLSVPGLEAAERVLVDRGARPDCLALLSSCRPRAWVDRRAGPRVRDLVEAGRVVRLAADAHLAVAGLTVEALPRALSDAGSAVSRLLIAGDRP